MNLADLLGNNIFQLIAVAGLALSIYNTYSQWSKSRPKLTVEFCYIDWDNFPELGGAVTVNSYHLLVKNLGQVSVIIAAAGIKWRKGKWETQYYHHILGSNPVALTEWQTKYYHDILGGDSIAFPYKLDPGSTFSMGIGKGEVEPDILKHEGPVKVVVRGFIKDGYGRYYVSDPFEVDLGREATDTFPPSPPQT